MKQDIMCGIYCITNQINSKKYVGQSIDIYRRWREHKQELSSGTHNNCHLQRAWDIYKEDNFIFEILELCDKDCLDDREKYWIKYYDSYQNGYNLTTGGDGSLGYKHDKEEKKKMSDIKKEQFKDIKNREKLSLAHEFESKPIYQIDFDGNIIQKWRSANWAAKTIGVNPARIVEVLKNSRGQKTYYGYIWVYVDAYNPDTFNLNWYINRNWKYKQYYQYDLNYNLVNIWESSLEAEKYGFLRSGITKAVNRDKTYKGYYWTDKILNEGRESCG